MITVTVPRPKNVADLDPKMFDEATEAIKMLARKANIDRLYANEYQREALRTAGNHAGNSLLVNGVMGLNGEAGECIDIVKKHLFQGHELDKEKLAKELGDVAWYLAATAHAIGYTLEEVMQGNIDKLKKRYPDGFEAERSLHRQEGDI